MKEQFTECNHHCKIIANRVRNEMQDVAWLSGDVELVRSQVFQERPGIQGHQGGTQHLGNDYKETVSKFSEKVQTPEIYLNFKF